MRRRLLLGLAGGLMLLTLLAGAYQYFSLRRLLARADHERLRARAELLLSRISLDPLPTLPLPDQASEQMRVVLRFPGRAPWEVFRSPGFPTDSAASPTHPLQLVHVQRPAAVPGPGANEALPTGQLLLWLARPAAPLAAELRQVRTVLLLGLLGSAGLAALLAAWLGGAALHPLRRISAQAQRIRDAASIEPLPVPATGDEVQTLAETLNAVLGRLREQAEVQANFLAAAAHELRTPLATLQLSLDVTGTDPTVPAVTREALAGHGAELRRLSRLVEDFLLVSRLRTPEALPLYRAAVELDELVLAIVDRALPAFRAAGRQLHLHIDEQAADYRLSTDADKLTTILLNLLDNARKHARLHTSVQVQVARTADYVGVSVHNELLAPLGDNLTRLTAPYFQADVLQDGAGLGLWISSRLAQLLGAELHFTEAAGQLRVELRFPVAVHGA
ncbi:hypothetical protein B0919_13875 [Hymenobacter sp. CRA2]|nr:hypothetical protein B0919_13875 [Hymenobacter sp. CRA2]